MKKTVYQEIVEDVVNSNVKDFEDYPEFAERGHRKVEFQDFLDHVIFCDHVMDFDGDINAKKAFVKAITEDWDGIPEACQGIGKYCSTTYIENMCSIEVDAAINILPKYRLFPHELEAIKNAEKFGKGNSGLVLEYNDKYGKKEVRSYDYLSIPANEGGRRDIYVIFSGQQETGTRGSESIFHYIKNNKKLPDDVMFLGLVDNQGLTQFGPKLKIRKSSEYRMYLRQALALGLPKGIIRKLLMTPHDTSTEDNIILIIETLNHYKITEPVNLIFVGYPVYQMRTATEMSWSLSLAENIPDIHIRIADLPTKLYDNIEDGSGDFENSRILSYDILDMQLADLAIGNCVAHLFREHNKKRFALPNLGEYPEEFKALLPLFLAYSYPNVATELSGTDLRVASILKLMRTTMLNTHDRGMSGEVQDKQQLEYTNRMSEKLIKMGLTSERLIKKGRWMEEEQFLKEISAIQGWN